MRRLIFLFITVALILGCFACDDRSTLNGNDHHNVFSSSDAASGANEGLVFEITGVDLDCIYGYCLKVHLENRSLLKTYWVDIESVAANGVNCVAYFEAVVTPLSELNTDLELYDSFLEINGVGDYTDIEVTYCVYDDEEMLTDPIIRKTIHYYPYGEEFATTFIREPQDSDIVLVDSDDITVVATRYEEDPILGCNVHLFFVNKSDKMLSFSTKDTYVNGIEIMGMWAISHVDPGKCGFSQVHWTLSEMKEKDINDVNEIQFTLLVYDVFSSLDDLFNDVITLYP